MWIELTEGTHLNFAGNKDMIFPQPLALTTHILAATGTKALVLLVVGSLPATSGAILTVPVAIQRTSSLVLRQWRDDERLDNERSWISIV